MADNATLYDRHGRRKYLTPGEAERFCMAARLRPLDEWALATLIISTGCRLSEALALTSWQLDRADQAVVFKTLKRRATHFRPVPVSEPLLECLFELSRRDDPGERLWPISRQTGWRLIKSIMQDAQIEGSHATARGLRHTFGVACILKGISPIAVQAAMGHTKLETTAIYQQVLGEEARRVFERLW